MLRAHLGGGSRRWDGTPKGSPAWQENHSPERLQERAEERNKPDALVVDAEDKLRLAAKRNPDAVAFGYVAGEWIAAA
jgi:hypothetical protein